MPIRITAPRGRRLTARLRQLATPRHIDVLATAGLLLWTLPTVPWWWHRSAGHPDRLTSVGAALVLSVPFLCRRRYPLPLLVWSVVVALVTAGRAAGGVYVDGAVVLVAAYGLGAYGDHRVRPLARRLGSLALAVSVSFAVLGNTDQRRVTGFGFALLGAAFLLGEAHSNRRDAVRAARDAASLRERTRIARELHDILTHQLSAIAVQAGAARLAAQPGSDSPPDRPIKVLATVEHLAREALSELNQLLGVLRKDRDEDPARRPVPSLGDLEQLLSRARASGYLSS